MAGCPPISDLARLQLDSLGGLKRDDAEIEALLRTALESDDDIVSGRASNDLVWFFATSNVRLDEAETLARAAVETDPENGSQLDTVAWVLHLKGDDAAALPFAEKAAAALPDNENIAENLQTIRKSLEK